MLPDIGTPGFEDSDRLFHSRHVVIPDSLATFLLLRDDLYCLKSFPQVSIFRVLFNQSSVGVNGLLKFSLLQIYLRQCGGDDLRCFFLHIISKCHWDFFRRGLELSNAPVLGVSECTTTPVTASRSGSPERPESST